MNMNISLSLIVVQLTQQILMTLSNFYTISIFNDAPQPWQLGFQDSAAPAFTGLVSLHNTIGFYLIIISLAVFWVFFSIISTYGSEYHPIAHKYLTHGTVLELIWTITPALILMFVAFPSFRLLYLMDEVISPTLTIKVIGFFLQPLLQLKLGSQPLPSRAQSLPLSLRTVGARRRQETKNGLKSNILNKIKDTIFGQKNIILKGKYGKENLNINFEFKFRMNQALKEEFNVHTHWPLLLLLIIKIKNGFKGQKVAPLYLLLFSLQKQRPSGLWAFGQRKNVMAREKITKINQRNQTLKIKQPKTSPFLGITRGLNNISAQIQPHNTKFFFHTRCRAINRIGPHNTDIISTIFGLLLGDGYAVNRTGEGVIISIKQSIIHKEYLFNLYEFFFLRGYCSNLIPRMYNRTIKGIDKIYSGYEFNTFTFRSFVWIYNSFYKKGKKKLPLNMEEFITPLTLAIWISDDGGWTSYGVRISCNSFTFSEVKTLLNILKFKFNLDCTIQKIYLKNKYSLYIKANSIDKLKELVLPHIHNSMYYKLGLV